VLRRARGLCRCVPDMQGPLVTSPDWKRAPHWARWAAMDASGAWYWFEARPALAESLRMWSASGFKVEAIVIDDWQNTAVERPSKDEPKPAGRLLQTLVLTDKGTCSIEAYRAAGWTDAQLVEYGYATWY
jgi:hypothetical protein